MRLFRFNRIPIEARATIFAEHTSEDCGLVLFSSGCIPSRNPLDTWRSAAFVVNSVKKISRDSFSSVSSSVSDDQKEVDRTLDA